MGLRTPRPSEKDLISPVPQQAEVPEPIGGSFRPAAMPADAQGNRGLAQPDMTPVSMADLGLTSISPSVQSPLQRAPSSDTEDSKDNVRLEALLKQAANEFKGTPAEKAAADEDLEALMAKAATHFGKAAPADKSSPASPWQRFNATMASRNTEEEYNFYAKRFGPENTWVFQNKIYVRPPGTNDFREVDPSLFSQLNGGDFAGAAADFAGDTAEFAAGAIKGAPAAAAEAGASVGATLATGNPLAGRTIGRAVGGAVQGGVDALAAAAYGVTDEDINLATDVALKSGLNMGFGMLTDVGSNLIGRLKANFASQNSRIAKQAETRVLLDEFVKTQIGPTKLRKDILGQKAYDIVDQKNATLGQAVGMVNDTVEGIAGREKRFSVDWSLKQMETELRGLDVDFNSAGYPIRRAKSQPLPYEDLPGGEVAIGSNFDEVLANNARAASTNAGTGAFGSGKFVDDLITNFEAFKAAQQIHGGVPYRSVVRTTRYFQDAANFDESIAKDVNAQAIFKRVQNAVSSDRNMAIETTLKGSGTPEENIWRDAYSNYEQQIGAVSYFRSLFRPDQGHERYADALLSDNMLKNPDKLVQLRAIMGGEGSETWGTIKGNYVDGIIKDSLDPSTGILLGGDLVKKLTAIPDNAREILFGQENFGKLVRFGQMAKKIKITDLLGEPQNVNIVKDAVGVLTSQVQNLGGASMAAAGGVFRMIGKDADAADWLLNEGFMQIAAEQTLKSQQKAVMTTANAFRKIVDKSRRVTVEQKLGALKFKQTILVPVPGATAVDTARKAAADITARPMLDRSFIPQGQRMGDPNAAPEEGE